jgi:hypothetical protein
VLVPEISWDEVVRAGTVIFGPGFAAAARAGGWHHDLKSAYRRRVLETHPDRAGVLGRTEPELLKEFRAVSEAYELLVQHRAGPRPWPPRQAAPPRTARARPPAPPRPGQASPEPARGRPAREPERSGRPTARGQAAPAPPPPAPAPFVAGDPAPWTGTGLPRRRLRLAEFLYYSGRIGWLDFVEAVAWQRRQRPAVGRIAVDFGFLQHHEVVQVLERRRLERVLREPFGEFAVRHGLLTPFQLLALLGQQLRLQRPIGQYFVERGLATDAELDEARVVIFRHNARQAA